MNEIVLKPKRGKPGNSDTSKPPIIYHFASGFKIIIWNTNGISAVYDGDVDGNGSVEESGETVVVGSTRKRYVISSKYVSHPLVNALIDKSKSISNSKSESKSIGNGDVSVINCEVVLFDHLLWMLENAEFNVTSDCLDELADLNSIITTDHSCEFLLMSTHVIQVINGA